MKKQETTISILREIRKVQKTQSILLNQLLENQSLSNKQMGVTQQNTLIPVPNSIWTDWIRFWKEVGVDLSHVKCSSILSPEYMYVLNPGTIEDIDLVEKLKDIVEFYTWTDLEKYILPLSHTPTFNLYNNSIEPDSRFLGKSANDVKGVVGRFMTRGDYIILQAFRKWKGLSQLDIKGWTTFPHNYLGGHVAYGGWHPGSVGVRLGDQHADDRDGDSGPRLAVSISLIS